MTLRATQFTYPSTTRFSASSTSSARDSRKRVSVYVNHDDIARNVRFEPLYIGLADADPLPFELSAREIFCENDCFGNGQCDNARHVCACNPGFNWTSTCSVEVRRAAADGIPQHFQRIFQQAQDHRAGRDAEADVVFDDVPFAAHLAGGTSRLN